MISYIIATYAGKDHTSNRHLSATVLKLQMEQLFDLFCLKRKEGIPNHITEVIIVCPPVSSTEIFTGYYNFAKWRKICYSYGVRLFPIHYFGENNHHSYDQWIQGMAVASESYYILMEDDYCINAMDVNVDTKLIASYKKQFSNGIGYLSMKAELGNVHTFHASISNGVVSKDTYERIESPLEQFYNIHDTPWPQVNFSNLFLRNHIDIKDYSDTYEVLFWNSYTQQITRHSPLTNTHSLILPIQSIVN